MKKLVYSALIVNLICACHSRVAPAKVLVAKDFAKDQPDWKVLKDTISKEVNIGFEGIKVPARISWLAATDSSGCLRVAFFRVDRKESEGNMDIKITNISRVPCAMKWESNDEIRFETLIFSGEYSAHKGIKHYNFKGTIGKVQGNGEIGLDEFK